MAARWITLLTTVLLSAGLLYLVLSGAIVPVDLGAMSQYWSSLNPYMMLLALLIFAANYPVNAWRFAFVSRNVGRYPLAFSPSLAVVWSSSFLTTFLPSSLAMDIGRIALLRQFGYANTTGATRIVLVDRLVGLFILVIISAFSLPLLIMSHTVPTIFVWLWLLTAAGIVSAFAVSKLPISRLISSPIILRLWSLVEDFAHLIFVPSNFVWIVGWGLINAVSFSLVLWLIGLAIGATVELTPLLLTAPAIIIISNMPFFYQGFGGREVAMVLLLEPIVSADATELVVMSVGTGAVTWISAFAGGVFIPFMMSEYLKNRKLVSR
jgi:uncharacterized membrane protein YbhN (UPF0104 family)